MDSNSHLGYDVGTANYIPPPCQATIKVGKDAKHATRLKCTKIQEHADHTVFAHGRLFVWNEHWHNLKSRPPIDRVSSSQYH